MERSEPSFVPEWLKNGGNVTGSSTTGHQSVSSSSNPDDNNLLKLGRNKSQITTSNLDLGRASISDRATSNYFRRSSSSNGSGHSRAYSNFGRNHRDRDWDKDTFESRDRDRTVVGDYKHWDNSDPIGSIYPARFEKDALRRSQSTNFGKRGDMWPRKVAIDANKSNYTGNGLLSRGSPTGSVHKSAFDRDFPTLGTEERPEIGRVPSPVFGAPIQTLPVSASAVVVGDKWTSALAEVPVLVGSNGTQTSYAQQAGAPSSASVTSGTTGCLNMAEALAQGSSRPQIKPQLSVETQRLEELAIKQSRQLIPVTPSMPKTLVLSNTEKGKPKSGQIQHQVPSQLLSQSPRGGPMKSDGSKSAGGGKLHVLKLARDKSSPVNSTAKDSSSPNGNKVANSPVAVTSPSVGSAPIRSVRNTPALASNEQKPVSSSLEKRPTSQTQSRNDFFNLMRKKSTTSSTSTVPAASSSVLDKSGETEAASSANLGSDAESSDGSCGEQLSERRDLGFHNDCDSGNEPQKFSQDGDNDHLGSEAIRCSEEEEAAFLRSLGWQEESNENDEGLTKEEIDAFFRDAGEYINSGLSSKFLQGVQSRFMMLNGRMGS